MRIASLSKLVAGVLALQSVADGVFALDDPVAEWLPELASPRVLISPDAPLDRTVATERPITVRQLLTLTHGQGVTFESTPFAEAIKVHGNGPLPPSMTVDEYLAWIGSVPLREQPGTKWMYHTGSDVLSALIRRAVGVPLETLVRDRLGMRSTSFHAGGRVLPTSYRPTGDGVRADEAYTRAFDEPPAFESLGGGLVSTVEDYLGFLSRLADGELLPPELYAAMTTEQLTAEQRAGITQLSGARVTWGFQTAIEPNGRYGWTGGSGASAYTEPANDLIGVVLTQRFMTGPREPFSYFWDPLHASL